jgi:putative SOS response-associated peptidase YedK
MCGRSTYKLTWEEIVALYRLTLDQPARNTQARYNVCPTTTIDTVVGQIGGHALVPMRWGLVPSWWSKPLKDLKLATVQCPRRERDQQHIALVEELAQRAAESVHIRDTLQSLKFAFRFF